MYILKHKNGDFPFKEDDTLVEPRQGDLNTPPISQEVQTFIISWIGLINKKYPLKIIKKLISNNKNQKNNEN